MASRSSAHRWEAPKFSFNSPNQAAEWQSFYTQALDFLEALDIDPEKADNCSNTGHFTALCRKPCSTRGPITMPFRCREVRGRSPRSTSRSRRRSPSRSSSKSLSRSPNRGRQTYRSPSRHSSHSPSQDHHRRRSPRRRRHSPNSSQASGQPCYVISPHNRLRWRSIVYRPGTWWPNFISHNTPNGNKTRL